MKFSFKKLSKQKKTHFVLVGVGTIAVLCLLCFGLIRAQYAYLDRLAERRSVASNKLEKMREMIKHRERLEGDLAESRKKLAEMEKDVASGDIYSWLITTMRKFKAPYKVDLPSFSPIGPVSDVNLVPGIPYKQASMTVAGTAHFHDLGRFLADFENQFPHIRINNLSLDLEGNANDPELLSFKMEIVTLVKPNAS